MTVRPDITELLADLRAEQADLRLLVDDGDLDAATPAQGWTVRDAIAHLAGTDLEADKAATDPDRFVAEFPQVAHDIDGFRTGQLTGWAHGQDVAHGLGVQRVPTTRLRHICHLGVRTRSFSYAVHGLPVPDVEVAVELEAPNGGVWRFGDATAQQRVTGPALDFCLLVTQRRHRDDTALVATGADARQWLAIAQCFAGPPGGGRPRQAA